MSEVIVVTSGKGGVGKTTAKDYSDLQQARYFKHKGQRWLPKDILCPFL